MNKTNDKWSFSDSFTWSNTYPRCSSSDTNAQSPINIDTDITQHCKTLCNFKTHYKASKCFVNYNNNLIRLKYSSGSYLEYQNILYELKEITIHTPSLHSFDNYKYDLEICLIHTLSSNNRTTTTSDTPNGIILSRLYEPVRIAANNKIIRISKNAHICENITALAIINFLLCAPVNLDTYFTSLIIFLNNFIYNQSKYNLLNFI